jgi:hypothetical protein
LSRARRLGWFLALWAAGVIAVAALVWVARAAFRLAAGAAV